MRTGNGYLKALKAPAHINDIDLYAVSHLIHFAGNLFLRRQHAFRPSQFHKDVVVFHSMDKSGKQFVLLICIFVIYRALFASRRRWVIILSGGLRPYASEILWSILKLYAVSYLIARIYFLSLLKRKLGFQIMSLSTTVLTI